MHKIISLAHPNHYSEVKFKIVKFPDGQQSIDIESPSGLIKGSSFKIMSRLTSFADLELIICMNQALRNCGATEIHLDVPYFLGARSDRQFASGGINYLKQVICPIINSQNFETVTVLDPHSDVLEACLNNFRKCDNWSLVRSALTKIDNTNSAREKIVLVSPDAGALKKIYDVAKQFDIREVITASKVRDLSTGKILHTEVPNIASSSPKKFVIVDDICDGGRTFIEVAKALRENRPPHIFKDEIYLIVTHGIFSGGLYELSKWVDKIFTTNSFRDIDVEPESDYTVSKDFVYQIKII